MEDNFLLNRRFRTTSFFHLSEWKMLGSYEQQLITGLFDESEVYGIFQPVQNSPAFTSKIAYKDVALLYMHLQHADTIPRFYSLHNEQKLHEIIIQLVLDNILAIEWNGKFVSGTAAVKAVYGNTVFDDSLIPDHLSILSMKAIDYALMLKNLDIRSMANRLYAYNTKPMDAATRYKLHPSANTEEFLFKKVGNEIKHCLKSNWNYTNPSLKSSWLFWTRATKNNTSLSQTGTTYKLYISPQINDLAENFETIIKVINDSAAYSFKTGSSVKGLLRPDKMVVYFKDKEALNATAIVLSTGLENCNTQGVPFTKQLDKNGLLSYGVDPLKKDILKFVDGGSWRTTVTDNLARAIIQAQQNKLDHSQSIDFIKIKLLAAGIDTQSWTPVNDVM